MRSFVDVQDHRVRTLNDEYERVWPFLEPAVTLLNEHTKDSLWNVIARGHARLWLGDRSAAVTSTWTYPSGLRVANAWIAGGDLDELRKWEEPMVQWAKDNSCTQARLYGRRGFVRALPGFREIGSVMMRDL